MVISTYRTKLTQMIQDGLKNPVRSDVNGKAAERPFRVASWKARNPEKGKA